ncbi:SPX domain-containing protein [Datura stramonium]|uniref:SPX domain-containing protein n=1 Tax=Datura stramonium TaxID=4076 RepID=A0ABS8TCY7_DATST|nr:SPX domain-containing protein [Datura stramonium]
MKFGKEFSIHLEETLPEWRDKYLCYKPLKKLLKHIPSSAADNLPPPLPALAALQDWFIRILNEELDKFNDFYMDKEEEFVIRFQNEMSFGSGRLEGFQESCGCVNGDARTDELWQHDGRGWRMLN